MTSWASPAAERRSLDGGPELEEAMSLYSLAPDADALFALEPEELDGIVLQYLNGPKRRGMREVMS